MATRGKSARLKGAAYERAMYQKVFTKDRGYPKVTRRLESQGNIGHPGIDLNGTEPWAVQCKARKDYVSVATINEITPPKGHIPLLITKGDHKPAMVVIPLSDFCRILEVLKPSLLKL